MNYEAFISYRRVDTEIAKRIYDTLTEQRHQVFFDVDSLLAGDFTTEIKAAIRDSELVVALLTCDSVQRMVEKPQTDMVRKELKTAQRENRPIQFLWLMEEGGTQSALYDQLAVYPEDELLAWLARQNIMPFTADEDDVRRICGKVLETLEAERRRKFEQLRSATQQDLHQKFAIGERQYSYHGTSRAGIGGKYFPYGEGIMVDESSPFDSLVYEGDWEGDSEFSGRGTVYLEKKDGSQTKLYQGHWRKMQYHDIDGCLYDEETKACIYRGCFYEGKRNGEEGERFFHIDLYTLDKKALLYSGGVRANLETKSTDLEACLYGEQQVDNNKHFKGWYYKGAPVSGELQFPTGERYTGEIERRIVRVEGHRQMYCGPNTSNGFGRMLYPDGRIYEGEWGEHYRSNNLYCWYGRGIALYPSDGMEVRVEGAFVGNIPSDSRDVETKVSVRQDIEQEFRKVYYSAANDVCLPGIGGKEGTGEFTFRDGSSYRGKLVGMKLRKGWLYTPDNEQYEINNMTSDKKLALGVDRNDRKALELVLHCMDEIWEIFQIVAKGNPVSWRDFYMSTFLAVRDSYKEDQDEKQLPEYPYGDAIARRALAMCKMPPSRLYLLNDDELSSVYQWFKDQNELDMETLKEMAKNAKTSSAETNIIVKHKPVRQSALNLLVAEAEKAEEQAFIASRNAQKLQSTTVSDIAEKKRILSGNVHTEEETDKYMTYYLASSLFQNPIKGQEERNQMLALIAQKRLELTNASGANSSTITLPLLLDYVDIDKLK